MEPKWTIKRNSNIRVWLPILDLIIMNEEKQKLAEKMIRLHNQLKDKERDRKIAMTAYKDEIGDIKDEIDETLEAINNLEG